MEKDSLKVEAKTLCCGKVLVPTSGHHEGNPAILWNADDGVVRCRHCGAQYTPKAGHANPGAQTVLTAAAEAALTTIVFTPNDAGGLDLQVHNATGEQMFMDAAPSLYPAMAGGQKVRMKIDVQLGIGQPLPEPARKNGEN